MNSTGCLSIPLRIQNRKHLSQYRPFHCTLLSHLSASLGIQQTSRNLRSSSETLFKIPKCSFKSIGDRSSSFIASSSEIRCLPVCRIFQISLTSKQGSKLSVFNRHFENFRRTLFVCVCVRARARACVCVCVYVYLCVKILYMHIFA